METPFEFGSYKTVGGYDASVYERIKYDGKSFLYGSVRLHNDTYSHAPMFWDENGEVYVPGGKWTLDDNVWIFNPHCKGPGLALLYSTKTYDAMFQSHKFNLTTPKPEPMNDSKLTPIKPGKYRMRNGCKAIIAAVAPNEMNLTQPVVGWWTASGIEEMWALGMWCHDGRFHISPTQSEADLMCAWIDKPEWDWSTTPPWLNWLAMDEGGFWYMYEDEPEVKGSGWHRNKVWHIPEKHRPKWSGDWKDSLVCRPGVEVKP